MQSPSYRKTAYSYAKESNWLSQNEREMILRDTYATTALKTISLGDRYELFKDLKEKKGKNKNGGSHGANNTELRMKRTSHSFYSPDTKVAAAAMRQTLAGGEGYGTQVQDPVRSGQKYQFD